MGNESLFAFADRFVAAFQHADGCAPYTLLLDAYAPSILAGDFEHPGITRSLRYVGAGGSSGPPARRRSTSGSRPRASAC